MRIITILFSLIAIQLYAGELAFEENKGQFAPEVNYVLKLEKSKVMITESGFIVDNYLISNEVIKGQVIKFDIRSNSSDEFLNINETKHYKNYFTNGLNLRSVASYKEIIQKNIVDKIDIRYYIKDGNFRYDFIVHPGADPSSIKIDFEGADIKSNYHDEIIFETILGDINMGGLHTYQMINDQISVVNSSFNINNNTISFDNDSYDKNAILIIDPMLTATYFGSSEDDEIVAVDLVDNNNYVVVGNTTSNDLQTTPGIYQEEFLGVRDIFISKFTRIKAFTFNEFTTYLGGTGDDVATAFELDYSNEIVVVGYTESTDFPSVSGVDPVHNGQIDGFITKFNENATELIFSTFLGGSNDDRVNDVAIGKTNDIFICGETSSTNFDVVSGAVQMEKSVLMDGFYSMINHSGRQLVFSSYLGGSDDDRCNGIDVGPNEEVILAGSTKAVDFPVAPQSFADRPYDDEKSGGWDMFFAKVIGEGGLLETSTYFGGKGDDFGIAVRGLSDGTFFFLGTTGAETGGSDLPISSDAFQLANAGKSDIMFGKLSKKKKVGFRDTQELIFNTYIGGREEDVAVDMRVTGTNSLVTIISNTRSNNFPDNYSEKFDFGGGWDVAYSTITATGNALNEGRTIGGRGDDMAKAFALDENDNMIIVGSTSSNDLSTTDFSFQGSNNGKTDAMIVRHLAGTLEIGSPLGEDKVCKGENLEISFLHENFNLDDGFTVDLFDEENNILYNIDTDAEDGFLWKIPDSIPVGNSYKVIISHESGLFTISPATFIIQELPEITSFTANNNEPCIGEEITFSAEVESTQELTYSWYIGSDRIPGVSTATYSIPEASMENSGDYKVVVEGDCRLPINSEIITISVNPETNINSPTEMVTEDKKSGESVELSVDASGNNLEFQWYFEQEMIEGAVESNYSIGDLMPADSGIYHCMVSGSCGEDIKSPDFHVIVPNTVSVEDDQFIVDQMTFNNGVLHLDFSSNISCNGNLDIVDLSGNPLVSSRELMINKGINNYTVPIGELGSGVYLIRINCDRFSKSIKLSIVN